MSCSNDPTMFKNQKCLKSNFDSKKFVIDKKINNKVLLSCNPNGFLKRIK